MMIYLFDIDGTLLHAHGSGRAAFDRVMHAQHGIADACRGIRFGGMTDHGLVNLVYRAHLGRDATEDERRRFLAHYLDDLATTLTGVEVIGGVIEALDFLAPRARLGIATGNVKEGAALKLGAAGLADRFAFGGYGCDAIVRADLVARGIERARAMGPVDEVIVVGDTLHDIAAARACGATVCAVTTGGETAEALREADVVFASLAELPAWHRSR